MNDRQKAELYHELAKLSEAGFPVIKACDAALDTHPGGAEREFLGELKSGVASGGTISGSAEGSAGVGALEVSVLRAAEEGGKVPEGFAHLARYFELRLRSARKIRAGLVYPAILLHLAILLPAIPLAVASKDVAGTAVQTMIILASVYAIILLAVFWFRRLSRRGATDVGADRLLRRLPLVGKVRHAFALSRFAEVLRIQLLCGRGPLRGIRSAAEASGSASLLAAARRHVLPEVEAGRRAGPGFIADRGANFPGAFARGYATAEEAGGIDDEMGRWSRAFADQAETSIDRLSAAVPKVVYAAVAVLVIYQVVRMALIYFDTIGKLMEGM